MSCVKVDLTVLGSPCLISLVVSVDVKQHERRSEGSRAKDLCESRGGRSGLPVPDSPYALCERKASVNLNSRAQRSSELRSCVKVSWLSWAPYPQ